VTVPASSANLGPGFDCMAAALAPRLELEVAEADRFSLATDLDVAPGRRNLAVRAFERVHPADGLAFEMRSQIPLSGGLGSSAAAIVAGLAAANAVGAHDADVLALAAELEGHADNAAAALGGGFVICSGGRFERIAVPDGLSACVVVPHEALDTRTARGALSERVPLADAVFNAAHAALLALALERGDLELLARALADRLHEAPRAALYPRSAALAARAGEFGALAATISGAGPTVLFWVAADAAEALVERLAGEAQGWAQVLRTPFSPDGLSVREL
jgi:homoserine kinase